MRISVPDLQKIDDDFKERVKNIISKNKALETSMTMFLQLWESTVLGFEGIGGQAITGAYTTVIWCTRHDAYAVYFDKEFAYLLKNPNKVFFNDMLNHRMARVSKAKEYCLNESPNETQPRRLYKERKREDAITAVGASVG
jgi:hypothetical protein